MQRLSLFSPTSREDEQLLYFVSVLEAGSAEDKKEMIKILLSTPVDRIEKMMAQDRKINEFCQMDEEFVSQISAHLKKGGFISSMIETNKDFIFPIQFYIAENRLKQFQDTVASTRKLPSKDVPAKIQSAMSNLDKSCEASFYDSLLIRCNLNLTKLKIKNISAEVMQNSTAEIESDIEKLQIYRAPGFVQAGSIANRLSTALLGQEEKIYSEKMDKLSITNYLCALELFEDPLSNEILSELTNGEGWGKFLREDSLQFTSAEHANNTILSWIKDCNFDVTELRKHAQAIVKDMFLDETPSSTLQN